MFVLNVLAFILVGFQLQPIIARLDRDVRPVHRIVPAPCASTILARIVWVTGRPRSAGGAAAASTRAQHRRRRVVSFAPRSGGSGLVRHAGDGHARRRAGAADRWRGWRAVSLPRPDLLTAFGVVLGTLVVQGLTLRPLMACACGSTMMARSNAKSTRARRDAAAGGPSGCCSPDADIAALVRHSYELQLHHGTGTRRHRLARQRILPRPGGLRLLPTSPRLRATGTLTQRSSALVWPSGSSSSHSVPTARSATPRSNASSGNSIGWNSVGQDCCGRGSGQTMRPKRRSGQRWRQPSVTSQN